MPRISKRRARLREASCRGQGEGIADPTPDDRDGSLLGLVGRPGEGRQPVREIGFK
jgi:hypothetical protein